MNENVKRTEKHEQARRSLPENLVPIFDAFVADYKFFATKHHGLPYVSYVVLAEMVTAGWRLVASQKEEYLSKDERPGNK